MKKFIALGLMSGTSVDGVDASLIKTDGYNEVQVLCTLFSPYTNQEKKAVRVYDKMLTIFPNNSLIIQKRDHLMKMLSKST